MNALEWLLVIELALILLSGVLWATALIISRTYADDPIWFFWDAFWQTFIFPPIEAPLTVPAGASDEKEPEDESDKPMPANEKERLYGRIGKRADGTIQTANLHILVQSNTGSDVLLGKDGDAVKVQVTGGAEEAASNKAVIQLVSDMAGVMPYQVTLTKGHYQSRKTVQIAGLNQAQLEARLITLPLA